MAQAPKRRGRPPKQEAPEPKVEPKAEPKSHLCTVLVMHTTNITLQDHGFTPPKIRKVPFRDRAIIPVSEYEAITAGDDKAKRPRRLEKLA